MRGDTDHSDPDSFIDRLWAAEAAGTVEVLDVWPHPSGRWCITVKRAVEEPEKWSHYEGFTQTFRPANTVATELSIHGGAKPIGDDWLAVKTTQPGDSNVTVAGDPLPGARGAIGSPTVEPERWYPSDIHDLTTTLADALDQRDRHEQAAKHPLIKRRAQTTLSGEIAPGDKQYIRGNRTVEVSFNAPDQNMVIEELIDADGLDELNINIREALEGDDE